MAVSSKSLAFLAVLLFPAVTACASSGSPGPLVVGIQQEGEISCAPSYSDGPNAWDAPIGYAEDTYWNNSAAPLTIESVSLIDPHNLALHGSVLYRMPHDLHHLSSPVSWAQEGQAVPPADWRARQRVPGAVMPPIGGPVEVNGQVNGKVDRWEIVVDVSAATPGGGWALGEIVRYRAGGQSYTAEARTGMGIGTSLNRAHSCDAQMTAMQAAFSASTS
jgi:hypothetical protein